MRTAQHRTQTKEQISTDRGILEKGELEFYFPNLRDRIRLHLSRARVERDGPMADGRKSSPISSIPTALRPLAHYHYQKPGYGLLGTYLC